MQETDIIHALLADPLVVKEFAPHWKPGGRADADGELTLMIEGKAQTFLVEVKREVRSHMLPHLEEQLKAYKAGLLVAARLNPTVRELMRERRINYLEANGNCTIRSGGRYVYIDGRPGLTQEVEKRQRAFSKAGLRVGFVLLIDSKAVEATLATLAQRSGTSIATVSIALQNMVKNGLLLEKGARGLIIPDRAALLHKWTDAYVERLKPSLARGRYRFAKGADAAWRELPIDTTTTCWGGEAAGALLTNHLHPGELTLYTTAPRLNLVRDLHLIPDPQGEVLVYERFWDQPEANTLGGRCCPPVLAYADLVHSRDGRCVETAQLIHDEHLRAALP
ncbi:MAG TPA: type IV toxin-antitoxin system AbiEi family antitoxin [Flavobacteriales bacterium]|nr:type IV toxin-antitoxin system AbiEi family antitoxin [Flavobacteriales bacterium]